MTLQEQFDLTYISSSEICQRLGVVRSTLSTGCRSGKLPPPIIIRRANGLSGAHILLWLRDQAEPMLNKWAAEIASRKGL